MEWDVFFPFLSTFHLIEVYIVLKFKFPPFSLFARVLRLNFAAADRRKRLFFAVVKSRIMCKKGQNGSEKV